MAGEITSLCVTAENLKSKEENSENRRPMVASVAFNAEDVQTTIQAVNFLEDEEDWIDEVSCHGHFSSFTTNLSGISTERGHISTYGRPSGDFLHIGIFPGLYPRRVAHV